MNTTPTKNRNIILHWLIKLAPFWVPVMLAFGIMLVGLNPIWVLLIPIASTGIIVGNIPLDDNFYKSMGMTAAALLIIFGIFIESLTAYNAQLIAS